MIRLGETARHLRNELGLTQRAAAEKLGISYVHLCNIEHNKSAPSPALLERYRELWNVDLYVLAWCLHGDTKKLPKALRKPMAELAEAWQEQIASVAAVKRRGSSSPCSTSSK
ncbi:MAG: helix-turn-helix transcriptional regulator [Planctomycetes bacterium]|nr:helix-turn-helix transcriptional regulator [Planctomycetota bacterium]